MAALAALRSEATPLLFICVQLHLFCVCFLCVCCVCRFRVLWCVHHCGHSALDEAYFASSLCLRWQGVTAPRDEPKQAFFLWVIGLHPSVSSKGGSVE